MIYGAYGYSGELVAEEAVRRGHRPVLAGRSEAKLAPLAARLGLKSVTVDLDDAPGLARAVDGFDAVFHAAGPFSQTSDPMVRACLDVGASYADITGEIPVFRNTLTYDAAARERGIVLMSGVGFDVVPTDCLAAYVAGKLPGATQLSIAVAGLMQPSAGTAKSMFEGMLAGGFVRRDGEMVSVPFGKGGRDVRFWDRERKVLPMPWGDLETAYWSTRIPNITTYMAMPRNAAVAARVTWRLGAVTTPILRG
ncbi:MAG: saccharopine dehydrogenase family protein, partial [Polyangiaceae bacterium]